VPAESVTWWMDTTSRHRTVGQQAWRFSISPIGLWLGLGWVYRGLHQPAPIPDQAQAVAG
jgi:hypothetical protein